MSRFALVSPDADDEILKSLKKLDYIPLPLPKTPLVDKRISGHPDIQLFPADKKIFCHPDIPKSFVKKIENCAEVKVCTTQLHREYPRDIPFNIAYTGEVAFHKKEFTDPLIIEFFNERKIKLINVEQGYAKCSTLIVDSTRIITPDSSIHQAALGVPMESLLVEPGHVDLPGFDNGFIGGASGSDGNNIILTGTISHHPDYKRIMEFMEKSGKRIIFLSKKRVVDLGTIFLFNEI